jgi:hypothetical protein
MSYSASELLNVFGFYLDHGMSEAIRVYPWHKDFLHARKDKTMYQVEVELLTPGQTSIIEDRPTSLIEKLTAKTSRKAKGYHQQRRGRGDALPKGRVKYGYLRHLISKATKAAQVAKETK